MITTKEKILQTSLKLFARYGYEAVSVSTIAGELNLAKSAVYKHYKSKQEIFDCILRRMEELDYERAKAYEVPEGTVSQMPEKYRQVSLEQVKAYTEAQFKYWTKEAFSSDFRRMLTLEQYRSEEMKQLYHQYLGAGPLSYIEDIFWELTKDEPSAKQLALDFYGPVFLLYSVYDMAEDKEAVTDMLRKHMEHFSVQI